jgi:group I intron endonuclease
MFIYKITNNINGKIYIGYDSGFVVENRRWKDHLKFYQHNKRKVLYSAMRKHGIENFSVDVVEEVETFGELLDREIYYIDLFQSHQTGIGYNRTLGGDGGDTFSVRSVESQNQTREKMKASALNWWANIDSDSRKDLLKYLNKEKWENSSPEERKLLTQHLHTDEIYQARAQTLKEFYSANPDARKQKGKDIKKWQEQNLEKVKEQNRINSAKGAAKVSKRLKVELEAGEVLYYPSKSEFQRKTGQWANTIIQKTQQGVFYNGYKIWEEK